MKAPPKPVKPSKQDLQEFSMLFSHEEWDLLCENQAFLDSLMEDLDKASSLAFEILGFTEEN